MEKRVRDVVSGKLGIVFTRIPLALTDSGAGVSPVKERKDKNQNTRST